MATGTMAGVLIAIVTLLVPAAFTAPTREGVGAEYPDGLLTLLSVSYWLMAVLAGLCLLHTTFLCIRFLEPLPLYHIGIREAFGGVGEQSDAPPAVPNRTAAAPSLLLRLIGLICVALTVNASSEAAVARAQARDDEVERLRLRSAVKQILWATEANRVGNCRLYNRIAIAVARLYDAAWCIVTIILASKGPQIYVWLVHATAAR
ncbi:MAG: hypothetical protein KGK12_02390 [Armatimonadetes bacterium]|nr:hypothetical protein [Armatimonadota bacterium]